MAEAPGVTQVEKLARGDQSLLLASLEQLGVTWLKWSYVDLGRWGLAKPHSNISGPIFSHTGAVDAGSSWTAAVSLQDRRFYS